MVFRVTAASGHMQQTVELSSIEELLGFVEKQGCDVIIRKEESDPRWDQPIPWELKLYDTWLE